MSRAIAAPLAALLLASCEHVPERVVDRPVYVEVLVPVSTPCVPDPLPELPYPDTDEALAAAPNIWEAAKLVMAGRLMRIQREVEYRIALAGCAKPVSK